MKKLILLFLVVTAGYAEQPTTTDFMHSYQGMLTCGAISLAAGTWLLGETLRDLGHRYADCAYEAAKYQAALDAEFPQLLSDQEKAFWATVQGLSYVPRYWWREIIASVVTLALYSDGVQALRCAADFPGYRLSDQ